MSLFCCLLDPDRRGAPGVLDAIARACSPRVQLDLRAPGVIFDVNGLQRVLGPPAVIAAEVSRMAVERGLMTRLAIAGTMTAAWVLASSAHEPITVVPPGQEAQALAGVRIEALEVLSGSGTRDRALVPIAQCLQILRRWGLRRLGELARLPEADVRTRLGDIGVQLHRAARGLDAAPLAPAGEPVRFCERIELEWPIEGLEPLSFVLGRLCDTLSAALERADRGAVTITTRLRLVARVMHERELHLPAPMRDARVLRTLMLLDLESHPPSAAIDAVEIHLEVTPARIVQGSLLARSLPPPEQLATLVARLSALMGETRVGTPALVDSHDERAFGMKAFAAPDQGRRHKAKGKSRNEVQAERPAGPSLPPSAFCLPPSAFCLLPSLRRFRLPIAITVTLEQGAPVEVISSGRGLPAGRVVARAGPWRSSGRWWVPDRSQWHRDEWDVELASGVFRLSLDRTTGRWEVEGVFD